MLFSYNWLQSFFKTKLPKPQKLAELLTMHSFEVEGKEKIGKDFVLDIDVLPNRGPDCFSHIGMARESAVILNSKFQIPKFKLEEGKKLKAKDFISVEVKDKTACPRYTARIVCNVKVSSSPKWIKDRLRICGFKPINNVVDILNYIMLETGQPLHAFDFEKIEGKKIIVRFAKKGEKIITLDNEKYDLNENILLIADSKNPLAIAGIKGGLKAGITKSTKTIVIESANFDYRIIRQGSKKINLKTDASWRFEHGIDPNLTEIAINRAAALIQKIAKGKVSQGMIDFYLKKVLPKRIKLDLDYVKSLLGMEISKKEILKTLKSLEFKVLKDAKKELLVEIPTFRLDISIQEDLIEEIGRVYGYEKVKPVFPQIALVPSKRNFEIFWENKIKDILVQAGFSEVYNYSFVSEDDKKIFNFKNKNLVEIENPMNIEQKYLRPSLIPNLLKNIQKNQKYFDEIKIFELGKIFKKESIKFSEKKAISGLIFKQEGEKLFYELKGVIDLIFEKLGIAGVWYDSFEPTPEESPFTIWRLNRCAEIKVNHTELGFLGELSPKISEKLKIEKNTVIFDIDFKKIKKLATEEHEYQPISPYPAIIRDISVLVSLETKVSDVLNKIQFFGGDLIRDVDLFDIYTSSEAFQGRKNFSFHIIYQAKDRTLKSKDVEKIQKKIIKALEKNPLWEVRK